MNKVLFSGLLLGLLLMVPGCSFFGSKKQTPAAPVMPVEEVIVVEEVVQPEQIAEMPASPMQPSDDAELK